MSVASSTADSDRAAMSDASNAEAADAPSLVVTFCHTKDELEMPLLDLKFR